MRIRWRTSLALILIIATISPLFLGQAGAAPKQSSLPVRPVIFVHGYCGTVDAWKAEQSIRMRLIQNYGYTPNQLHIFEYPKSGDKEMNRADIALIANKLMQDIDRIRRTTPGADKVDIVAHSMGGLVTRYYMSCDQPDQYGTVYQNDIARFIEIASPNQGSPWAYGKSGFVLWDLTHTPRLLLSLLYGEYYRQGAGSGLFCMLDPVDIAATQMVPGSDFLNRLNQQENSPKDVEYYPIYGQIVGVLETKLFKWIVPIVEQGFADLVVPVKSATTIPGAGDLEHPGANYHVNSFITKAYFTIVWNPLFYPFTYAVTRAEPYPMGEIQHGGLVNSENTTQLVDRILRGEFDQVTPEPVIPPPGAGGATATTLVMDVSGSMQDQWQGGVKLTSAVDAASRIVRRVQHENEVSGPAHRMALVSFSSDAQVDVPLGSDLDSILAHMSAYSPQQRTNIGQALQLANEQLANAQESRILILLTDGKSNEGLSESRILSGPVAEAAQAGTCIYTVGFGDRGDLNEDFLQQVAAASTCGGYYYASQDVDPIMDVYVRLRHITTGELLGEHSGSIAQGEQKDLGYVEVPAGRGEAHFTLDWKGSILSLILNDPQGRAVDENYPEAHLFRDATSVYALVQNPLAGRWQWSVRGDDIPQGTTTFYTAASVRGTATSPAPSSELTVWIAFAAGALVAAVGLTFVATRRPTAPSAAAVLYVTAGSASQMALLMEKGPYSLGRDPENHLVLLDPQVSRQQCQVTHWGGAFYILDLNSANGTYVDQVRLPPMQWHMLRDGSVIHMGNSILTFQQGTME